MNFKKNNRKKESKIKKLTKPLQGATLTLNLDKVRTF